MASDNLNELGKIFRGNRKDTDASTRRYSENYPMIETIREELDPNFPFLMEFFTYKETPNQVFLDFIVLEEFDPDAKFDFSYIPVVITQTGLPIPFEFNEAQVGLEGSWYPLVQLRDINFLVTSSLSVVFDIQKSGTMTLEHKIVFDTGGVDLTGVTTIGSTTITVPIVKGQVTGGNEVLDAYIYGRITSMSVAGYIYYSAATVFDQFGRIYTPKGMIRG